MDALLKAGADPELVDSTGNNLLKVSAEDGRIDTMMALIRAGCSLNARNHNGASALHFAARNGQSEAVSLLLNNNALMYSDSGGSTPLIMAARNCHKALSAIKLLIDANSDLDAQDWEGKTALHYMAHKAVGFELLLAAGANPNIKDCNGNTPMIMAATEGFDNVIKCLILYNANPDLLNSSGNEEPLGSHSSTSWKYRCSR
jgi:ankyrin repeat protein